MKYRSTDIVEPNGIRSARTDWWPVGIALSSVKRVPLRTRLQIGLTAPPHSPLPPVELPVDRGPVTAIRFSFVTKFAVRPSDDTWPSFNCTGNAANPGDTYTRPNPPIIYSSAANDVKRVEFLIVHRDFPIFVNDIPA